MRRFFSLSLTQRQIHLPIIIFLQLYVNGEFIGGCDIVTQMHESGELAELLKEVKSQD